VRFRTVWVNFNRSAQFSAGLSVLLGFDHGTGTKLSKKPGKKHLSKKEGRKKKKKKPQNSPHSSVPSRRPFPFAQSIP
jgi:hypothetical protein